MFYSLNPVLPWCRCRFVMTHPHNSRCRVSRCTTFMRICSIVCNNPHLCNIIDPHNSKIDFLGRWTNLEAAKLAIFLQTYSCIHDVTQYVSLERIYTTGEYTYWLFAVLMWLTLCRYVAPSRSASYDKFIYVCQM